MKQKIKVDIKKCGEHSEYILKAVGAHNEGVREITPLDLQAYLKVREAMYHSTSNDLAYFGENSNTLAITSDKGKSYSLILEWVEVHELKDDIPQGLFTTGVSDTEKEIFDELDRNRKDI